MSNAVSLDIITLLGDNGFGTIGTDLFNMAWGNVDKQILIMDTEGFTSDQKLLYEQPAFQVLIRGGKRESGAATYDRARLVHLFLNDQPDSVIINGTEYLGFEPQSNLAPLPKDENQRRVFTMNYFTFRNPE